MRSRQRLAGLACAIVVTVVVWTGLDLRSAGRRFYDDDPIAREPASQDASKAASQDVDLFVDLMLNLFTRPGESEANVRAGNVNTVDEVPDSSWFTNRIGTRPVSVDEAVRGPIEGAPPATGKWTITRAKSAGFSPGFTATDSNGETWFVSFDQPGYPEAESAAVARRQQDLLDAWILAGRELHRQTAARRFDDCRSRPDQTRPVGQVAPDDAIGSR